MSEWRIVEKSGFNAFVEKDGQLGYAKTGNIWRELLASRLAAAVGVPVPSVEASTFDGETLCSISHVHSCASVALAPKGVWTRQEISCDEKRALEKASGLLPFLAWIAAGDHNDDTNLVIDTISDCEFQIVAIDFEHAFEWGGHDDLTVVPPRPPALSNNLDDAVVRTHLTAIERMSQEKIEACCIEAQLAPEFAERIAKILVSRQKLVRPALLEHGLLAETQ